MPVKLRDYQIEALDALSASEARGVRRNVIVLPTGSGKTVVFGALTAKTKGRTLILAHRDELISQAVDKLQRVAPDINIGVVKAERNDVYARVVVASVQTLVHEKRRRQLFSGRQPFERVIVDECQHIVAKSYRTVLDDAGCFKPDGPLLLGVTATPKRGDKVGLDAVMEEICFERDLLWGIRAGYLSDLRGKQVYIDVDFDQVRTTAGDFQDGDLGEAMEEANAPEVIAHAYQEHAPGRRTIVFTPTVRMAQLTMEAMVKIGVKAEMVSGAMPTEERRAALLRFHSGETAVIANCAVLLEGFDEEAVDCIIIARPTKSQSLWTQMCGRGTRRFPGKDYALIIDLLGNSSRHKLVTVNTLFGLPLSALKDGKVSVTAAIEEQEEREARAHGVQYRARDVDLFGQAQFHWIPSPNGWLISAGGGMTLSLTADENQEKWQVIALPKGERSRVIAEYNDMSMAMGAGEDYVRNAGSTVLAGRDAPWRLQPASEAQIGTLRRNGVPIEPGMSKGAASDALSILFAGKRR